MYTQRMRIENHAKNSLEDNPVMTGTVIYKEKKIKFRDAGEGPAIVLLHGFLENMNMWDYFFRKLSHDYRVITIDLPGFGGSECLEGANSMEEMARVVNTVLQQLEVKSSLMIGHSMGGYVCLAYASMYQEKLKGFGLFHSHALADTTEAKANRDRAIKVVRSDRGSFIFNFFPELFAPENVACYEKDIKKLHADAMKTTPDAIIAALEGMKTRTDKLDVLMNTKVPVLFILGKKDSRIPFEKTMEQTSLPSQCEILALDDAGHMGHIEARVETLNAIKRFARKIF